ncbi:aminotransferase class IV [Geminocystis sp. NIES-3709]|uniref:aminotransferase class IV n=1 Tax=Geminocystis sp. NIES-3709 TaxID=1617448 RepID=UPI0005FCB06C|nr:aminotransferase class IV [Geminocystis sp. NIES-3709]BAQ66388.1 aminodeoxychorismate lyase [Geminocystis sp. NIES-3709]
MFYHNGQLKEGNYIELDIYDSTWLYGATIFTTLRVYEKSLFHPLTNWNSHCDRLKSSIIEFGWMMPHWEKIEQEATVLLEHFPVLRITLFPDGKELIIGRNLPLNLEEKQKKGVKGLVSIEPQIQRSLPLHKTGNYLSPWLALQQTQKQGYDEAILTDLNHNWLETSTGNLWGYKRGIWFTPALETGILPGIARKMILEKADFPIEINHWSQTFVQELETIVYSNSVMEIIPFNTIKTGEIITTYNVNHPSILLLKKIYHRVK